MTYSFPFEALKKAASPFEIFGIWYRDASEIEPMFDAVTVATATVSARPSARTLLLKSWDDKGFVFYTNDHSRQGREMAENPQVALLFYWKTLKRQIRIEGTVSKIPAALSDAYFASRPYVSRIGALASEQSSVLASREILESRVKELETIYPEEVPRPKHWNGYLLTPDYFEFWQDGEFRLHDRMCFKRDKTDEGWRSELLYP